MFSVQKAYGRLIKVNSYPTVTAAGLNLECLKVIFSSSFISHCVPSGKKIETSWRNDSEELMPPENITVRLQVFCISCLSGKNFLCDLLRATVSLVIKVSKQ